MDNETKTPICVTLNNAAELIDSNPEVIRRTLVATGEITSIRTSGNSRGSRIRIAHDELVAYGLGGLEGLREFRKKHRRNKTKKPATN